MVSFDPATDAAVAYPVGGGVQAVAAGPGQQVAYSVPSDVLGRLTPGDTPAPTTVVGADSFGLALGGTLVLWFGFAVKKVAIVATAVALAATLAPDMPLVPFSAGVVAFSYFTSRDKGEIGTWFGASWGFAKQILPLLFIGVLVAGALLGRPGHEGLIPSEWVSGLVGGNSLAANLFASVVGAFMYFATLTEVPILQGLIGAGMGKGPALALLLAGPALSLPSMLVIRTIIGTQKTLVFVALVVVMATVSGMLFGTFFG